ncbi:MAG TPA: FliH/SctL family protein [Acidimicrobiales bacterium]|nr:FliH/SctL family protein [Acidimicrobiales bacterium]
MSSSNPVRSRILRGPESRRAAAAALTGDAPAMAAPGSGAGAHAPMRPSGSPVGMADRIEAARAEGYTAGYEAGAAESASGFEAARAAQLARMADALVDAAASAAGARAEMVRELEAEAVHLAFELAEAIVRRELTLSRCVSVEALRRAIGLVPNGEDVLVRVHPGDVVDPRELAALLPEAEVKVVSDPAVEAGGCVVEAGPCRIDAQIGPAIERARALLAATGVVTSPVPTQASVGEQAGPEGTVAGGPA